MLTLALAAAAPAQRPAAAAEPGPAARAIGVVQAIDAAARHITIRTDAGPEMLVHYDEKTSFQRVAPGEKDLKNATPVAVSEIAAGDRVLVRGTAAGEGLMAAASVIVMAQADLIRRQAAERAEWEKRGTGGLVTTVHLDERAITISVPGLAGAHPLVIALAEGAQLRRYAPDSVKFRDARPSRLEDIQPGDQVRALGRRSADGSRFIAEQVVSGSFRNALGTVEAVNPNENSVRVREMDSRTQWLVVVNPDSNLRRLLPFDGGLPGMRAAGTAGMGTQREPRPRDIQPLLERMPVITLADLKPGDIVAVASTRGADTGRMTAITILAGVEPLLRANAQSGRQELTGSWNLDLNMNLGWP